MNDLSQLHTGSLLSLLLGEWLDQHDVGRTPSRPGPAVTRSPRPAAVAGGTDRRDDDSPRPFVRPSRRVGATYRPFNALRAREWREDRQAG